MVESVVNATYTLPNQQSFKFVLRHFDGQLLPSRLRILFNSGSLNVQDFAGGGFAHVYFHATARY